MSRTAQADRKYSWISRSFAAGGVGDAGVEHLGDRFRQHLLLDGLDVVALVEDAHVHFLRRPGQ